jgi:hypothetical protein
MNNKNLRKGVYTVLVTLFVLLVAACIAPKQRAINQLQEIHDDLELNYANYNAEKWKQFARDYREADSLIALYEYTPEEKEYIGTLRGEISGYVVKAAGYNVVNAISNEGREVIGILKGIMEVFTSGGGNENPQEN